MAKQVPEALKYEHTNQKGRFSKDPAERRRALAADVQEYLKKGNKINRIK